MLPQQTPQPNQPPQASTATPMQNMLGANQQQPQQNSPQPSTPPSPGQATHIQDPNAKFIPPNQRKPNPFSRPVPGQSLTDTPKNAAWEHPPQFTDVNKAMNYVFDQVILPQHLRMFLSFLEKGKSIEDMARIILFTGFSQGKWSPDLAMLMSRPLVFLLSGIAHRAGKKTAKLTNTDRSGFDNIVKLQKLNISSSSPTPTPATSSPPTGLMAPK